MVSVKLEGNNHAVIVSAVGVIANLARAAACVKCDTQKNKLKQVYKNIYFFNFTGHLLNGIKY